MAAHEHMFLVDGGNRGPASLAFCEAGGYSKEEAREQVRRVLAETNGDSDYALTYIGTVDHSECDPNVEETFKYFERHDPVWLFGNQPQIICTMYITASINAVWDALTNPDVTERYWFDTRIESDWKPGSPVRYVRLGEVTDEHTVLEVEPLRRLSHTFHPVFTEEYRAEPPSHVTFTLEQEGGVVRLTMVHTGFPPGSKVFAGCSQGWPMILNNLKTLLETGKPLPPFGFTPPAETG